MPGSPWCFRPFSPQDDPGTRCGDTPPRDATGVHAPVSCPGIVFPFLYLRIRRELAVLDLPSILHDSPCVVNEIRKRNAEIVRMRRGGAKYREIAERFERSPSRPQQVVRRFNQEEELARRSSASPRLRNPGLRRRSSRNRTGHASIAPAIHTSVPARSEGRA